MRCRDARKWLGAQRDGDRTPLAVAAEEHLKQCSACSAFQQDQQRIESMLGTSTPRVRVRLSTDHIMLAVEQRRCISQQLEDIRHQQQNRMERLRPTGAALLALGIFTLSSVPLLVLAITILRTDLVIKALSLLNGFIDVTIIFAQYLHMGLLLMTRNSWLLSGAALVVVVMIAMWLRLMRYPTSA